MKKLSMLALLVALFGFSFGCGPAGGEGDSTPAATGEGSGGGEEPPAETGDEEGGDEAAAE